MNLLRRVIVENRVVLAIVTVAILANLAVYVFLVHPLQERVSSGVARAAAATRAERVAERELESARAAQTGKQTAESQLQTFYHKVLPGSLADARKAAYVRISQMAAQANLRSERLVSDKEAEKKSPLMRLQLVVTLDGNYQDVRRFIHAIETAPEFLVIDNMALVVRSEPSAPLLLTLAVSTYFWNGADAS